MKTLPTYIKRAIEDLEAIDITIGNVVDYKVNYRAKSRWGLCRLKRGSCWEDNIYTIEISSILLSDDVSDNAIMNTLIHEMLHTCKNCMKHNGEWKELADRVNAFYPQYNIKRTTTSEEKGISDESIYNYKYMITCNRCGVSSKYIRKSKVVSKIMANPLHSSCICGKCKGREFTVKCF